MQLVKTVTVKKYFMLTPFIIYIRAVGIYALVTIPALLMPIMYFFSMMYVLIYGWFAWALFTLIYLLVSKYILDNTAKLGLLTIGVVVSVAFAFQMLEVLKVEYDVWHRGLYLLFPLGAVIAGLISLYKSRSRVICKELVLVFEEEEKQNIESLKNQL